VKPNAALIVRTVLYPSHVLRFLLHPPSRFAFLQYNLRFEGLVVALRQRQHRVNKALTVVAYQVCIELPRAPRGWD